MRKVTSLLVCLISVMLIFCSCSGDTGEDVNYIITFKCENKNDEWKYEMQTQGIVTVTPEITNESDKSVSYSFILESVGEGETNISFLCFDTQKNEETRKADYLIKVDKDYKITAELLSDSDESTASPVSIKSTADAESYVEAALEKKNPDDEGKLFCEAEKLSQEKYIVRVFRLETNSDGKAVKKYIKSYVVFENGKMKEKTEDNIQDVIITVK